MRLFLDFETSSEVNLRDVNADVYFRHESTRALMLAWAVDDGPVDVIEGEQLPSILIGLLQDPTVQKVAWNAPFEIAGLLHRFHIDISYGQWFDPMILARYLTLPSKLSACSAALGLANQKDPKGKRLTRMFSQPSKATAKMVRAGSPPTYLRGATSDPVDWAAFIAYCRTDVSVMRECLRVMETYPSMPKAEWNLWRLDQKINLRGMPVDATYVAHASKLMREADAITLAELKNLTGLRNPNSGPQMKKWLSEQGCPLGSIAAECVDAALLTNVPPLVRDALLLHQKLSGAGPKKLSAIANQVAPDGLLRNQFTFYATHTGRWSSRGVQVQNLPRSDFALVNRINEITCSVRSGTLPTDVDTSTAISSTIRSAFRATKGHRLVLADYVSIENRVLAWLAPCKSMLTIYREGRCAYKDFAVRITGHKYEDITKQERTQAKPAVLGCGYGMGASRLAESANDMGIVMSEEEALVHVKAFRESYPEIPALWGTIQRNAFGAVQRHTRYTTNGLVFDGRDARFLRIGLASGRDLFYLKPEITVRKTFYGETESMSYESTGKAGVQTAFTYGAKLTENVVQALSRDILCCGLRRAVQAGFDVIAHVHDEIVCEEAIGSPHDPAELVRVMERSPTWAPDLLLVAEGSTFEYYRK